MGGFFFGKENLSLHFDTCALLNSGSLKCWGENTTGQLGLATTQSPVYLSASLPSVNTGIQVSDISSSADTTCALSSSGEAKCWGSNDLGQLGIGSLAVIGDDEHPSSIPVISTGQNLSSISAGNKHVCGTTTTGNLFCWGYGEGGRLGYGNATSIGDDELPSSVGPVPGATIGGGEEPPASIAYDEQDRLLRFGTKTFTYNGNGDLLTETDSSTGSIKTFDYDVFGNLKEVILPNKTISYKVDAHNRRVAKLENGAVVEYYLWNARNQLIGKADPNGLLLARYVYGSKAHVPDYIITDSSEFHIVTDHLGSPVVIVDSNSGTVVQEVKYDEFGIVLSDSNPGFTPFGFAGCLFDQDTKLCRFGARDYDASIGRWLSKDPILFAGGDTNLYGYVMQDPVNFFDPSGLFSWQATKSSLWTILKGSAQVQGGALVVGAGVEVGATISAASFGFATPIGIAAGGAIAGLGLTSIDQGLKNINIGVSDLLYKGLEIDPGFSLLDSIIPNANAKSSERSCSL